MDVVLDVKAVVLTALHRALQSQLPLAGGNIHMQPLQTDVVVLFFVHGGPGPLQDSHCLVVQAVDVADEVAHELGGGVVIHLVGGADLLDEALVEYGDAVGQGEGLLLVVGDVNGGDAEVLLHLFQFVAQLHPQFGVQVGQGLVHTDDGRAGDQGPGDGHPLLLAAGQLGHGLGQLLIRQIHLFSNLAHLLVDLRLFDLLDLQAEGDVVVHRHGGEQGVALKDDADVAVLDGHAGDVPPLYYHGALRRLDKAGDGAQSGGLSAAGGAQEGKELPLLHVDVDAVQGSKVTELYNDIIQADHDFLSFFSISGLFSYLRP